ncbi:MAG: hypothetical protein CVV04_01435 [Firmicutes bacterium HGW-Firmicutes-9]|jgi:hypothetical protein|nr:MAG: hypothetical protein CVV04_01435 [Firmicutes bacterium HGW-Firmicutes-9]
MGSKKTWVLISLGIILFLCIAGAIVFLLREEDTDSKYRAISVYKVSYTKVTGMKITQQDSVIDMVKTNGVWQFRDQAGVSVDQGSMESALTMVCYLYAQDKLYDEIENLSNYGLDPAVMQVEIELDDGTNQTVRFGSFTSARDGVFMTLSGSDALYVYDLDSYSILENAAKAMRDLTIDIDADELDTIEILRASGARIPILMTKIPENRRVGLESWMLQSPFTAIANAKAVSLVKSFFASPRYSSFVADTVSDDYGLNSDSAYIYLKESGGKSVKIWIGNRLDSGRYYCMQEGGNGVYELASGFEALLEIETENLFPIAVFPVSAENPVNVTINLGSETFQLDQSAGGGFTLNGKTLSEDVANTLFAYLAELQFRGVVEQAAITAEPNATIVLEQSGNELVYRFYGYRNDYYAVEFNGSGSLSGYIKADHLAVLAAAFNEASKG